MNSYKSSYGTRFKQDVIDRKIRVAKLLKLEQQVQDLGYNVCEDCKRNDCLPLDCSHDVSVGDSKKQGKVELAWTVSNITIRGRKCHQKLDKLNLKFCNGK